MTKKKKTVRDLTKKSNGGSKQSASGSDDSDSDDGWADGKNDSKVRNPQGHIEPREGSAKTKKVKTCPEECVRISNNIGLDFPKLCGSLE